MKASLDNMFSQFAHSVEAEISAANDRAEAKEGRLTQLVEALSALVGQYSANDNEAAELAGRKDAFQIDLSLSKKASRHSSASLDEAQLFNALSSDWITAGRIRQLLISRGINIAEGTVYNRMRKLASKHPDQIEAASKPERWRLRAPREATSSAAKRGKFAAQRAMAQSQHLSIVPTARASFTPANSGTHRPVLHHGDCLEVMKTLPDDSVDLILADLPYGTTRLAIDKRLNLDELWTEYRRILRKPHGNIVLFGSQPFTTALINAAPDIFRYPLVWDKNSSTGFQHAGSKPLKKHEDILVFSFGVNISEKRTDRRATFNDQHAVPVKRTAKGRTKVTYLSKAIRGYPAGHEYVGLKGCQNSILSFPKDTAKSGQKTHPFAKPLALLEHLIRIYSDSGDVVLDNTMGSGSTCIAAMRSGRGSIGIEMDEKWFRLATERVANEFKETAFERAAA